MVSVCFHFWVWDILYFCPNRWMENAGQKKITSPLFRSGTADAFWEERRYVRSTPEPIHFCIILRVRLQGHGEVDRAWDSCRAQCYVVNARWNSQINGGGSSPNWGSIPGCILVPWAVIQSGRRQYLLLPWHGNWHRTGGAVAAILVPLKSN